MTNYSFYIPCKRGALSTLGVGFAVLALLAGCGRKQAALPSADPASDWPASSDAAAPRAPDAMHGSQLFAGTCSGCHGPQGQGLPHLGKDLQTSRFVGGLNDEALANFVEHGRPVDDPLNTTHVPMPPRGGNPALSDQDIRDIVAFVRQLQQEHAGLPRS